MYFIQFLDTNKNLNLDLWIQVIVGVISSGAIIIASFTASHWNKREKKEKDLNELSYFLGCLQILRETMNLYFLVYIEMEDIEIAYIPKAESLNSQIKLLISEIDSSKVKLTQLLKPYYDSKKFLYLLFSLNDLYSTHDKNYYENLESYVWDEVIKDLTDLNEIIAKSRKLRKGKYCKNNKTTYK